MAAQGPGFFCLVCLLFLSFCNGPEGRVVWAWKGHTSLTVHCRWGKTHGTCAQEGEIGFGDWRVSSMWNHNMGHQKLLSQLTEMTGTKPHCPRKKGPTGPRHRSGWNMHVPFGYLLGLSFKLEFPSIKLLLSTLSQAWPSENTILDTAIPVKWNPKLPLPPPTESRPFPNGTPPSHPPPTDAMGRNRRNIQQDALGLALASTPWAAANGLLERNKKRHT